VEKNDHGAALGTGSNGMQADIVIFEKELFHGILAIPSS
jgi:hypothetical protein